MIRQTINIEAQQQPPCPNRQGILKYEVKQREYIKRRYQKTIILLTNLMNQQHGYTNKNSQINKAMQVLRQFVLRSYIAQQNESVICRDANADLLLKYVYGYIYEHTNTKQNINTSLLDKLAQQSNQFMMGLQGKKVRVQKYLRQKFGQNRKYIDLAFKPHHNVDSCLQCKSYIQNKSYYPTQQPFTVLKYNQNKDSLDVKFKQKMCAILNIGGGYLILDGEEGLKYALGSKQLRNKQQQWTSYFIKHIKQSIFPKNYHTSIKQLQTSKQKSIICFKIVPNKRSYTYFWQKDVDKKIFTYKYYQINYSSNNTNNNQIYTLKNQSNYYNIIHQKYYQSEQFEKYFDTIHWVNHCSKFREQCILPYIPEFLGGAVGGLQVAGQDSKSVNIVLDATDTKTANNVKGAQFKEIYQKTKDVIPVIVYKHQSLLILKSENDDSLIHSTQKRLLENKMQCFIFMKPYTQYRSNSNKSIWHCSHEYPLQTIKSVVQSVETQTKKLSAIIAVTKYIKIEKCTQKQLVSYFKAFEDEFNWRVEPDIREIESEEHEQYNFYLSFEQYQESQFSFLYLDNIRIRLMFMKEKVFENVVDHIVKKQKLITKKYKQA